MKFEKFKLLCWKNFTLQKRHKVAGIFEILFPIVIVYIFVFARNNSGSHTSPEILFPSFVVDKLSSCGISYNFQITSAAVSPDSNEELKSLVKDAIGDSMTVTYFKDSSALNEYLRSQKRNASEVAVGLEFSDSIAVSHGFDICRPF